MDFRFNERTTKLVGEVREFVNEEVIPNEARHRQEVDASGDPYRRPPVLEEMRAKARDAGLWNLFLPTTEWGGYGLSNLEFAPVFEEMGRTPHGSEVFNCQGPDAGNMMALATCGTDEQQEQWLLPLLAGEITSCFAMTEPDVASSDVTNISARIERDGDEFVINGRKWFSSGSVRETCKICIFVGVTDPDAQPFATKAMVLVPLDTPGVELVRDMTVFGYRQTIGHGELHFRDVRVPVENLLEEPGSAVGQSRLGPGRLWHAMRAIGLAERSLELMCNRVASRETFGRPLAEHGVIQDWIGRSRIEIEQTRLLALRTAWTMDEIGGRLARREIAAIKVACAKLLLDVVDRAIQAHGAAGLGQDTILPEIYAYARSLRFVDGPDEVHLRSLGRWEVRSQLAAAPAAPAPAPALVESA
ncbi:MAG TPA: acyl-CoA dehydrogenase family protein [Solirubrobacterales bacterium]|nr:acyl-CoA dehydrogenase family protein [Solirubrobacterales bacterium]